MSPDPVKEKIADCSKIATVKKDEHHIAQGRGATILKRADLCAAIVGFLEVPGIRSTLGFHQFDDFFTLRVADVCTRPGSLANKFVVSHWIVQPNGRGLEDGCWQSFAFH